MSTFAKIIIWPFIVSIRLYQWIISPWIGKNCRFVPSCSTYFMQALEAHGIYGFFIGLKRVFCCHPWSK